MLDYLAPLPNFLSPQEQLFKRINSEIYTESLKLVPLTWDLLIARASYEAIPSIYFKYFTILLADAIRLYHDTKAFELDLVWGYAQNFPKFLDWCDRENAASIPEAARLKMEKVFRDWLISDLDFRSDIHNIISDVFSRHKLEIETYPNFMINWRQLLRGSYSAHIVGARPSINEIVQFSKY